MPGLTRLLSFFLSSGGLANNYFAATVIALPKPVIQAKKRRESICVYRKRYIFAIESGEKSVFNVLGVLQSLEKKTDHFFTTSNDVQCPCLIYVYYNDIYHWVRACLSEWWVWSVPLFQMSELRALFLFNRLEGETTN